MTPRRWLLESLTIGFDRRPVVRDIDVTIQQGDFVAVLGRNGSGKSCLLKTMSGGLPPLAGAIHAPQDFGPDKLGVVPQVTDIVPRLPLTLGEMALLGLAGMQASQAKESLADALAVVDLADRSGQPWQASSGGERQRTLIARALIRRPEVLLLDEPTSHLDTAVAESLLGHLSKLCAAGKLTVIAVLHDAEMARGCANKLLLLADHQAQLEVPA